MAICTSFFTILNTKVSFKHKMETFISFNAAYFQENVAGLKLSRISITNVVIFSQKCIIVQNWDGILNTKLSLKDKMKIFIFFNIAYFQKNVPELELSWINAKISFKHKMEAFIYFKIACF